MTWQEIYYFFTIHKIFKSILIGHSMGGKTAMKFSLLFPERVEKLIIVDIAPKNIYRILKILSMVTIIWTWIHSIVDSK